MTPASFDLDHLRALAATVQLGDLEMAAVETGLPQSAIIQAIARLEAQTGHNLMSREEGVTAPSDAGVLLAARAEAAVAALADDREVTMAHVAALVALAEGDAAARGTVAELEQLVGVTLADGTALNKAGARLAGACRLAVGELQAGLDELAVLAGQDQGTVRIAAHPSALARLLPEALARFIAEHRPVVLDVQPLGEDSAERLTDGRVDMIVTLDVPELEPFERTALTGDPLVVAGRTGHSLANAGTAGLVRLASEGWVLPPSGSDERTAFEDIFIAGGIYPPSPGATCPDGASALDLAERANLLTLVSKALVTACGGRMAAIGGALAERRMLVVATRRDWAPTPAQATFIDELRTAAAAEWISF